MPAFVTGIAPTQDVGELEKLLGGIAGVDRSKFVVITSAEPSDEHDDSFLQFAHVDDDALILDGGGTRVPDLETHTTSLGYLGHPHVVHHVGTLPIPDDEADNYNDAIENGRTVVAYPVDGNASGVETAFHGAGLAHVKTFRG
ncbi:MAG TPA: hypothetical protein VMF11_05430 [Candidatus Baltobacteraceae bacterium]|nr:hypothetical protein [Candidatus Baltobacteraceae bacterium]